MKLSIPAQQNALPPRSSAPQPVRKPVSESWTVNGETFDSTANLLPQGPRLDRTTATYSYHTSADNTPFTPKERVLNSIGRASAGLVTGGVIGGFGSAFIALSTGLGDALSVLGGGRGQGVSKALLLAPVVIGSLIGAGAGAVDGYKLQAPKADGQVTGLLKQQGDQLHFYPNGHVSADVNLNKYADAETAPVVAASQESDGPVLDTLKGAACTAAIAGSLFIPVIGLAGGAVVGSTAGKALDSRTEFGEGVGLALGAAATVGTIVAANVYGTPAIGYAAAGLGVVGAVLGHQVFSKMEQGTKYDFGKQWWNAQA